MIAAWKGRFGRLTYVYTQKGLAPTQKPSFELEVHQACQGGYKPARKALSKPDPMSFDLVNLAIDIAD